MGRTNSVWLLALFYDREHTKPFKIIDFNSLREIAYCMDCEIYDISNLYHKISKPKGKFVYVEIYKSL